MYPPTFSSYGRIRMLDATLGIQLGGLRLAATVAAGCHFSCHAGREVFLPLTIQQHAVYACVIVVSKLKTDKQQRHLFYKRKTYRSKHWRTRSLQPTKENDPNDNSAFACKTRDRFRSTSITLYIWVHDHTTAPPCVRALLQLK